MSEFKPTFPINSLPCKYNWLEDKMRELDKTNQVLSTHKRTGSCITLAFTKPPSMLKDWWRVEL